MRIMQGHQTKIKQNMKIHGTAKGGALTTKNFGVAFGGNGGIPCTSQELGETNDGTQCTGIASNNNTVWVAITTATVSENDKIEKIGVKIGSNYSQPYGLKLVAYADNSGSPDGGAFVCMTESHVVSDPTTGYVNYDVVNASGSVEAHTITADEAGYLWIGNWSDSNNMGCYKYSAPSWQMSSQTYDSDNTVTPTDPFTGSPDTSPTWQLRGKLTVCVVD